jgi:hypothetical protein
MAFTGLTASSTSLQLNLTNAGNLHVIKIGPELLDLAKLAAAPSIVGGTATGDVFAIGHAGKFRTDNFNTFSAFVSALAADLAGANMPTVVAVASTGQYDTAKNVFTAQRMVVLLSN